jgi:hypothetical protein
VINMPDRNKTPGPVPEGAKPAVAVELKSPSMTAPVQPAEAGVLDGLFQWKPDDIVKGFVFSQILTRPRAGQRGGNPWSSRY